MPDIKTKDVVKGTIKQLDKAAIAADRMRTAYVQTKEKAEHSMNPSESNPEEYASDRITGTAKTFAHETAHQVPKQTKKAVRDTKETYRKAKDGVEQFKEKRVRQRAETIRREASASTKTASRATGQTSSKIKQSTRSAGKKTVKTVEKGTDSSNRRRRLGCCCCDFGYLPDWIDCWLCIRNLLFG